MTQRKHTKKLHATAGRRTQGLGVVSTNMSDEDGSYWIDDKDRKEFWDGRGSNGVAGECFCILQFVTDCCHLKSKSHSSCISYIVFQFLLMENASAVNRIIECTTES